MTKRESPNEHNRIPKKPENQEAAPDPLSQEEHSGILNEALNNAETELDEVAKLEDVLEENLERIFSEISDPKVIAEHTALLEALKSEKITFLRIMSEKLSALKEEAAVLFRDKRISKESKNMASSLSENKILTKFNRLSYSENKTGLEEAKRKAQEFVEKKMQSASSLFQTIKSADWGTSKHGDEAINRVNTMLGRISYIARELSQNEPLFEVLDVYENNKTVRESDSSKFLEVVPTISRHLKDRHTNPNTMTAAEMDTVFRGDPFLICEQLDRSGVERRGANTAFLEKQIDTLIDRYPKGGTFPEKTSRLFATVLNLKPEKYCLDSKNRQAIFEVLRSYKSYGQLTELQQNAFFFKEELENLSPEEVTEMVKSCLSDFRDGDIQNLLSMLPLGEEHLQMIHQSITKQTKWNPEDATYSTEDLLAQLKFKYQRSTMHIPFFQWKKFNLDPETRSSIFSDLVSDANGRTDSFCVLMNVLGNFQSVFDGLPEEAWEENLDKLIEQVTRNGNESLHLFSELSGDFDIPQKYAEKIKTALMGSTENQNMSKFLFGKEDQEKPVVLNPHESWLSTQPELVRELEIKFYTTGAINDLRHFFYEVMEGKREAVDHDALVRAYAERIQNVTPEEFIDLFVVRKKIDMSHAGAFLNKVKQVFNIPDQLEELVRLKRIDEKEYHDFLTLGSTQGPALLADFCFNTTLDKNLIPVEGRAGFIKQYAKNIFQYVAIDTDMQLSRINQWMREKNTNDKITPEEKQLLFKEYFNGYVSTPKLHFQLLEILRTAPAFSEIAYPDTEDRKRFVNQVLKTDEPRLVAGMLEMYGFGDKTPEIRNNDQFFSLITEEEANTLFERGLAMKSFQVDEAVVNILGGISPEQQKMFRDSFLAREDIFPSGNDTGHIHAHFAKSLSKKLMDERSDERKNLTGISVEDSQKMFRKIFESKQATNVLALFTGDESKNLLPTHDPVIFNDLVIALQNVGSEHAVSSALTNFTNPDDRRLLTEDQVKNLSKKLFETAQLSGKTYRLYRESTPENKRLYLDQDMFTMLIGRMSDPSNITNENIAGIFDFLMEEKNTRGKENTFTLKKDQGMAVTKALLMKRLADNQVKILNNIDSSLFEESLIAVMNNKKLDSQALYSTLVSTISLPDSVIDVIIPYTLTNEVNNNGTIEAFLDRFRSDERWVKQIKRVIDSGEEIENKGYLKGKLLERDLLEPDEIKFFYEDIRTEKDVRSGVLLCAEMLGSLVSSKNPEAMKSFLSNQEDEVALKQIEEISSFVQKNPQQNKGRTIAVMLFAREFLPELSAEEVISRAANQLAKHERILNQYSYEGVPKGLRVSLGTELELTGSTSKGYEELTGRNLKNDIVRLSKAAHIGEGRDAIHEIATQPTLNPYLLVLELQLLQNLEYMDLNFDRSELYARGSHSFHMTVGGERGLKVGANMHFLQNAIVAAGWGGLLAGARGKSVSAARGVALRGRDANDYNNIQMFDTKTSSVEMRSISPDKMEPTQRAIVTTYHGGVAIQALEKYTNLPSDKLAEAFAARSPKSANDLLAYLEEQQQTQNESDRSEKDNEIIYAWAQLLDKVRRATEYHNNDFLMGETIGYIDEDGIWIEREEFRGEDNRSMFEGVVTTIDPTLSVEEYVDSTKVQYLNFFAGMDTKFSDILTKINNLYLKPDVRKKREVDEKEKGDRTNALSMLSNTKFDNKTEEHRTENAYLGGSIFETHGERREGYYALQGGSERMITHAVQRALLAFNSKMETLLNT